MAPIMTEQYRAERDRWVAFHPAMARFIKREVQAHAVVTMVRDLLEDEYEHMNPVVGPHEGKTVDEIAKETAERAQVVARTLARARGELKEVIAEYNVQATKFAAPNAEPEGSLLDDISALLESAG